MRGRIVGMLCVLCALASCGRNDPVPLSADAYRSQLQAMAEEGQPEGANGWPLILDAVARSRSVIDHALHAWEAAGSDRDREPVTALDGVRFGPLDNPRNKVAADLLGDFIEGGVFEMIDRAGDCPRFVEPLAKDPWSDDPEGLREGAKVLFLGTSCASAMRLASGAENTDGAVYSLRRGLTLARACGWQVDSLTRTRAIAIAAVMLREVRQELMESTYDTETCARLQAVIDKQLPMAPVARCVRAIPVEERWAAAADRSKFREHAGGTVTQTLETIDGMCDSALAELAKPSAERGREGAGYSERVVAAGVAGKRSGSKEDSEEAVKEMPLVEHVAGALRTMLDMDVGLQADLGATRVMLCLEMYRHRHGSYPATLEALVPEFMDYLPVDPSNGGSFIYKLVKGDASGRPYLLYSAGPDGHDDGCDVAPLDAFALGLANVPAGHDYDFTEPRRDGD